MDILFFIDFVRVHCVALNCLVGGEESISSLNAIYYTGLFGFVGNRVGVEIRVRGLDFRDRNASGGGNGCGSC